MNTWTRDELDRFGAAEEIEITPVGGDDALRRAITIWMVRLGDNLYVRSAYGRSAAWFRAAETDHQGRSSSGGIEKTGLLRTPTRGSTRSSIQPTAANIAATDRHTST